MPWNIELMSFGQGYIWAANDVLTFLTKVAMIFSDSPLEYWLNAAVSYLFRFPVKENIQH